MKPPPRVFFDANVLIAAFAVKGLCSELLEYARFKTFDAVTSERTLAETSKNFRIKLKMPASEIDGNIKIIRLALDVIDSEPVRMEARGMCPFDPPDEQILSDALNSEASLLVTGDQELLVMGKIETLEILSPRNLHTRLFPPAGA